MDRRWGRENSIYWTRKSWEKFSSDLRAVVVWLLQRNVTTCFSAQGQTATISGGDLRTLIARAGHNDKRRPNTVSLLSTVGPCRLSTTPANTTMIKDKMLKVKTCTLQITTCMQLATCNKPISQLQYKLQGNGRRHVRDACHQGRVNQQAPDTTQWAGTVNWTVRCDWLQVAIYRIIMYTHNTNEGCKTCATLAELIASFIVVVKAV